MTFEIPLETKKQIKRIAYYQIIGGLSGLLIGAWGLTRVSATSYGVVIFFFIGAILFSFSIYCGQRLLKGEIHKALKLSSVNQILQLFTISVLGFSFTYTAGLYLALGFDYSSDFKVALSYQISQYFISFEELSKKVVFQVNLVALFVLYWISKVKQKVEKELSLYNSLLPAESDKDILQSQKDVFF